MLQRSGIISRIDAVGMQIAQIVNELNEELHMQYKNMEVLERVEYLAMVRSLDDALCSLRSGRKMFSAVGYSTEKGAQAAAYGLDMQNNELQSKLANETMQEKQTA